MKLFAVPFLMFSSAALVGAGCATDEADDVSTSDDALLTCGGVHHNPEHHRGHHHHRHHHGHGGGTGMMSGIVIFTDAIAARSSARCIRFVRMPSA